MIPFVVNAIRKFARRLKTIIRGWRFGRSLGSGADKKVYADRGRLGWVLGVIRQQPEDEDDLSYQRGVVKASETLDSIRKAGIPCVENWTTVGWTTEAPTTDGQRRRVVAMPRYVTGCRSINPPWELERAGIDKATVITSAVVLAKAIRRANVHIPDFQVLVDYHGNVKVSDPLPVGKYTPVARWDWVLDSLRWLVGFIPETEYSAFEARVLA